MSKTALRATQFKRSELAVQSTLMGWPGATRRVIFLIVPPRDEETTAPVVAEGDADDVSANRRARTGSDE